MRSTDCRLMLTIGLCAMGLASCARSLPSDVSVNVDRVAQMRKVFGGDSQSSEGSAAAAAEPTGFADFGGQFKIVGTPPQMAPLTVSGGDAAVCAPGGRAPLSQEVEVGPDNGLANVLIYVDMEVPVEWEHEDYVATREALLSGDQAFDQKDCIFLSHVFAMRATQSVEVLNSDPVSHNTNVSATGRAKTMNELLPRGSKLVYSPGGASRGPFPVTCNIHPWMKAYMAVQDHPYFAVTDNEGRFLIKNVPAGVELTFRVWQERVGNNIENVTINDTAAKWSRGKFTLTLEPDQSETWNVALDASMFQ